jgi:hypothetical protein
VSEYNVQSSSPASLARIFELDEGPAWQPEELGAILRHQLEAPMQLDLGTIPEADQRQSALTSAARHPAIRNLRELFAHPAPPLEMLEAAKDLAKALRNRPDAPVPPEIATVLYFEAIVVARLRCGQTISHLDEPSLKKGVQWALAQPWLDEGSLQCFREALQTMAPPPPRGK